MDQISTVAVIGSRHLGNPNRDVERHGDLPAFLPWVIGGAWILALVLSGEGLGHALGHDHLIGHGPSLLVGLGLFLAGWQVMVAAMMLPSSTAAFRWFDGLTRGRPDRHGLGAAFLGGYLALWAGVGSLAFLGDIGFHRFVEAWPWLDAHPWLIAGSVLALAGAFELSPFAGRCVRRGSVPTGHRARRRRFVASESAARLGADHGLRRLARCWPLMLLSFAVGMASLGWMVALTLMMVVQERSGDGRAVRLIGVALLVLAALVIAHPAWMPSLVPSPA